MEDIVQTNHGSAELFGRTLLRLSVAWWASRLWKLWIGKPWAVSLVPALRLAALDPRTD